MIVLTGCDGPVWERASGAYPQVCEHRCRRDAFPLRARCSGRHDRPDQGSARRAPRHHAGDPDGGLTLAQGTDRPGRLAQVREPAAHRIVQDPRCLPADRPADARKSAPAESWRPAPATTRRASRSRRSLLGIKSTVFMPNGAPIPKEKATRGYGAEVRFTGTTIDDCLVAARRFAAETGAVLIHPFDHADIVAGQGTCGLEILEQVPDVKTVIVPTGGGGLPRRHRRGGQGAAARRPGRRGPGRGGRGVPRVARGRRARSRWPAWRPWPTASRSAVPARCRSPRSQRHVDEIRTVSEESLSRALLALLERAKLVVEPAGAAAVAALLDSPHDFEGPIVAVLSGGNIDPLLLMRVIRHGMAAAGSLPGGPVPDPRPARRPGRSCWPSSAPARRTSSTSCTSGPPSPSRSTRSRSCCRWRCAVRSTATWCSPSCASAATTSRSSDERV